MKLKNIYMEMALIQAEYAFSAGEVPVGAVIVFDGAVIASSGNEIRMRSDPTAHAEILAIRRASEFIKSVFLDNCDLYTTLEPCPMCAYAISLSRISKLYFGAYDVKSGGVDNGPRIFNSCAAHHIPDIYGGLYEEQSARLLRGFFEVRRSS